MNPTQVRYPWRAALRTLLAYVVTAAVVLPIAYQIAEDALRAYLSPEVLAGVAWLVGLLVAISTAVTRIMAIPQVNDWLTRMLDWGAAPQLDYTPQHADVPVLTDEVETVEAEPVIPAAVYPLDETDPVLGHDENGPTATVGEVVR